VPPTRPRPERMNRTCKTVSVIHDKVTTMCKAEGVNR
jgi:hypothetical protein